MTSGEAWLIAVVGGALAAVLAAAILRLVNKTFSRKMWGAVWRVIRWPFSIRVTTKKRLGALHGQIAAERAEAARVRGVAADHIVELQEDLEKARSHGAAQLAAAEARARDEVEAVRALAKDEAMQAHKRHLRANETAREFGRVQGRAEAMAEVDAQRAVRLPRPVWRIDEAGGTNSLLLRNMQPDVVLSDVSLEAPLGDFVFAGPSQWPGPMSGPQPFFGERQGNGRAFGVKFIVRWHDANGDPRMGEVFIDKEPRRAVVF